MSEAEMKELYDAALLAEAAFRGHKAPGFARRSAYRAMLAAEAAAIEAAKEALLDIATKFYAVGSPESRGIITALEHFTAIRSLKEGASHVG